MNRSLARTTGSAALLLLVFASAGCNIGNAVLGLHYFFIDPFIDEKPVEAKFTLPAGAVLVRVRGQGEIETSMPALTDLIGRGTLRELNKNVTDCTFIPMSHLNDLRRRMPTRYAAMEPRELGNRLKADTLIDVQIADFRRSSPEEGDERLAYMELLVRVIDCRTEALLWPEDRDYEILQIKVGRFRAAQDREEFSKTLDNVTTRASDMVAKLFYRWIPPKTHYGEAKD